MVIDEDFIFIVSPSLHVPSMAAAGSQGDGFPPFAGEIAAATSPTTLVGSPLCSGEVGMEGFPLFDVFAEAYTRGSSELGKRKLAYHTLAEACLPYTGGNNNNNNNRCKATVSS